VSSILSRKNLSLTRQERKTMIKLCGRILLDLEARGDDDAG
jgi:hypothetical protein